MLAIIILSHFCVSRKSIFTVLVGTTMLAGITNNFKTSVNLIQQKCFLSVLQDEIKGSTFFPFQIILITWQWFKVWKKT